MREREDGVRTLCSCDLRLKSSVGAAARPAIAQGPLASQEVRDFCAGVLTLTSAALAGLMSAFGGKADIGPKYRKRRAFDSFRRFHRGVSVPGVLAPDCLMQVKARPAVGLFHFGV